MAIQTQAKIPVLDFSNVDEMKPNTMSWLSARKDVCLALEEYGCFVAEFGSRVPLDLHNTMFGAVRELFDFPKETKWESVNSPESLHRYFSNDCHERIVIQKATALGLEVTRKFANVFWPRE
ncbi:putative 2-oxoglutarate-dependent dioxygenase AOP1.2 [Morella rubra]|uniref:Putative 2-oxoglutarate-dependent dioxygenase AOP1.2 n=1 Tax=Morella rubra TaxID=262757 RepID=A0A6A1VN81_9ROSI|nr:putative 2-oxoglutarate-dependent dioxygenase AOP1.2 [Morella rubra]